MHRAVPSSTIAAVLLKRSRLTGASGLPLLDVILLVDHRAAITS